MKGKRFLIMGDGYIAKRHRKAIYHMGGQVDYYDPAKHPLCSYEYLFKHVDYTVICSPTQYHWEQITAALLLMPSYGQVIVEKPMWLPWQPFIHDSRINVVLQYRLAVLPKIYHVNISMVRDMAYMRSWKGDHTLTGGFIFNLFIHYLDIAYRNRAEFTGRVSMRGGSWRQGDSLDLNSLDQNDLYLRMYQQVNLGYGTKPDDIKPFWDYLIYIFKGMDYDDSYLLNGEPFKLDFRHVKRG